MYSHKHNALNLILMYLTIIFQSHFPIFTRETLLLYISDNTQELHIQRTLVITTLSDIKDFAVKLNLLL